MRLILLGPPGGGKGTVAKRLQVEFNIPVISTGVILREAVDKKNKLGIEAENIMRKGGLVPDHIILEIIKERIKQEDCKNGYIFDGFPRNIEQANSLEKLNKELNEYIDYVFYFEIPFSEIIKRLSNRRVCRKCGTNYNLVFNPPKKDNTCDICNRELYQREDDKEETIKNRLEVFAKQTIPLKNYYKEKKLLKVIDANLSENAFLAIKKVLRGMHKIN
ncbi:adenylate kinase [Candidatus Atribacteria bacterium RBG_19FT_COMBO_35_14]|uniref:Adenylate kinase n=1 Tax=Candidatus Sediminicultor quintus TaxID=1797291 RepID=A0A1F5AGE0_9BACT|nr:MAG: adenylate kinase [Candidatus Atribacteria bacterium RBG_19FT_COMBO_35_14]OGD33084.1 MAG: adenylate kinase [Candidatus Atribacteria bacterium RBG_16_35_8]